MFENLCNPFQIKVYHSTWGKKGRRIKDEREERTRKRTDGLKTSRHIRTHTETPKTGRFRMSAFHFHQRLALGPGSVCDK